MEDFRLFMMEQAPPFVVVLGSVGAGVTRVSTPLRPETLNRVREDMAFLRLRKASRGGCGHQGFGFLGDEMNPKRAYGSFA